MNNRIICNVNFIKSYMEEHDLSLTKLAEEIGISPATLSRVLNGQRNPGQMVMGNMLKYFAVPFEDLFSYNFELTNVNSDRKRSAV